MKSYTRVASFPSSSNPSKQYTVSKDEEGALSCDCPAWKFKKGDGSRTCKHVQAVEQGEAPTAQSGSQPKPAGVPLSDLMKRL